MSGLNNRQSRLVTPSDMGIHRVSVCWKCNIRVDNELRDECGKCGWIKCKCGACGCGYQRKSSESQEAPIRTRITDVREVEGAGKDVVEAVIKCDRMIRKAFARLRDRNEIEDKETVLKWFQDKIQDIKIEFDGYIYLTDLMFLIAGEIKDLIEEKRENQLMAELSIALRNEWIRLTPPDFSRSGKAFWGLKDQDWNTIRSGE